MDGITRRFINAQNDQRLESLFVKYPLLRGQLKEIFNMTIQPSNEQLSISSQMGPKGFYRRPGLMNKGKWTQEKADRIALEKLCEGAAQDQGVNEFLELCGLLLDSEGVKQAHQSEFALPPAGD